MFGNNRREARREEERREQVASERAHSMRSEEAIRRVESESGRTNNRRAGGLIAALATGVAGLVGGYFISESRHEDVERPRTFEEINEACAKYVLGVATEEFSIDDNDSILSVKSEVESFVKTQVDACVEAEVPVNETQYPAIDVAVQIVNQEGN